MTMRILVKKGAEEPKVLEGVKAQPTTEHRGTPTTVLNKGTEELSVNSKKIEPLSITLSAGVGDRALFDLWKTADFTVIVVEGVEVANDAGEPQVEDVIETRYERLKPVSFVRDHGANRVYLTACTKSVPIVEVLEGGGGGRG